eukprot:12939100-Prorocentrum_lima.AAC.1
MAWYCLTARSGGQRRYFSPNACKRAQATPPLRDGRRNACEHCGTMMIALVVKLHQNHPRSDRIP